MFAYDIARTERNFSFFDKVLVMMFVFPVVRGQSYNEACHALEKQGRLIPTQFYPFYTQKDMNLYLWKN